MAAAKDPADQVEAGRKVLDELRLEEEWEQVWKTALKQTVNPPTITHRHHTSDALADGTVVEQQMFAMRLGLDPTDLMNTKTETQVGNGSPHRAFVFISGWLQVTIQRRCLGWQKQGRAISIYSDEVAMIAAHSEGVLEWLRDQGRSYGVRLKLATQRPAQLPEQVRQSFLTMAALIAFDQDEESAAKAIALQLGVRDGEWMKEDLLTLQKYTAVLRCRCNGTRLPGFVMSVPFFEGDMPAAITGWGFTPRDPDQHPATTPPTPDAATPEPRAEPAELPGWALDDTDFIEPAAGSGWDTIIDADDTSRGWGL